MIYNKNKNLKNIYTNKNIIKKRIIFIVGEINDQIAIEVITQLLILNKKKKKIYIYINSYGGSVTAGLAIYDTIKYIKSKVSTICIGNALSMAAILLCAGNKGNRYSLKHSRIMIHQPIGTTTGPANAIKIQTKEILKINKIINKILAKNTNKNINTIKKDTKKDFYMSAKKAKSYGIIDKIIK